MTVKKERGPANKKGAPVLEVHDLSKLQGKLRRIGGSMSDDWNSMLIDQVRRALWFFPNDDAEAVKRGRHAVIDAMLAINPKDEFEGMIAAQLIACHNASMECYRRAMLREQTFEGRRESLSQASKLSRTYATLLETLNRHRGKGQQKVVVEQFTSMPEVRRSRHCRGRRGRGSMEIRGSSSCKANCPCTSASGVERGQGGEAGANRQRCQTAVAGCTAGLRREPRRAIRTL
jgi:hypothetical protein